MTPCRLANTYQLYEWSRALLETLIFSQLVKKFEAIYENLTFIPAFTRARPPVILNQINPANHLVVVFIEVVF
jgi:hypothetical protein